MAKKTNNIVFYEMWYDAILQQPEEIQPQLLMAVMNYAFYGIEPEDTNIKMVLSFIKGYLDADKKKYEERCERNRRGAKTKAESRKSTEVEKVEKVDSNTNTEPDTEPNTEPDTEPDTESYTQPSNEGVGGDNNNIAPPPDDASLDFDSFLEFYKSVASGKLPELRTLHDKRKQRLNELAEEYGKDAIAEVIRKAAASNYIREKRYGIDKIMEPDIFLHILEGGFDDYNPKVEKTAKQQTNELPKLLDQAFKQLKTTEKWRRENLLVGVHPSFENNVGNIVFPDKNARDAFYGRYGTQFLDELSNLTKGMKLKYGVNY